MSDRPRNHGYAAFERADVDDAKRGRPDFDLRVYADERGLEYLGQPQSLLAGWKQALPRFPEYAFNLTRGALPGGAFGVMYHEAFEIGSSGEGDTVRFDVPGGYHSTYYKGVGSATALSFLPFIGWMFSKDRSDVNEVPFGLNRIWVPCTVVAVRVSEPIGVAPEFKFLNAERAGRHTGRDLAQFALPDTKVVAWPELPDDLLALLMDDPHRLVHQRWVGGYIEVRYAGGTLVLRRNGFLRDPAMLDQLAMDAGGTARQFADACLPRTEPRPFEQDLPPRPAVDPADLEAPVDPFAIPPGEWSKGFMEYAERHGLVHEDPRAFHSAFPTLPSPGQAVAVMRGTLPGTSVEGRVVYYAEHPVRERQNVRGAIVFRTGHDDTPPEGVVDDERGLVFEARAGLGIVWSKPSWGWKWAYEDDFPERAAAFAGEANLYA